MKDRVDRIDRIDRIMIGSGRRVSRPWDTSPGGYQAVSNSLWTFHSPPGGYPLHRTLGPVGLSNTAKRIDSYPVGYRISRRPTNWKDTRRADYHTNWIPPAKGAPIVALAGAWLVFFVRGGFASVWFDLVFRFF